MNGHFRHKSLLTFSILFLLLFASSKAALGQITAGTVTTAGIGTGSGYIKASSSQKLVLDIALTSGAAQKKLSSIAIKLVGSSVQANMFNTLATGDVNSGISLYLDDGDGIPEIGSDDTIMSTNTLAWTTGGTATNDTATFGFGGGLNIPINATTHYFVVIRTNATLTNAQTFQMEIAANGLNTNDTDYPASTVTTSNITTDTAAPTFTIDNDALGTWSTSDMIQVTASDTGAGVSTTYWGYSTDSTCDASDTITTAASTMVVSSTYNQYICFKSYDLTEAEPDGNVGYSSAIGPIMVDTDLPTITFNNPAASTYETVDFDIDISDSDTGGSALTSCEYMVESNNGSWVETQAWAARSACNSATSQSVTVGAAAQCLDEGADKCRVTVRATDGAGNFATAARTFGIDFSSPTVTFNNPADASWQGSAGVVLDITDTDTGSGINTCEYMVESDNGGGFAETQAWSARTTCNSATSQTVTVGSGVQCPDEGSGKCRVTVRATDNVSKVTTATAKTFNIDYTDPVVTFNGPANTATQTVSFDIDVSDSDAGSGLSVCEYRVVSNGAETQAWTSRTCNNATSANITVGSGMMCQDDGPSMCSVTVRATDNSTNTTTAATVAYDIDFGGPTGGALTYTNGYATTTTLIINYGAVTDIGSGVLSNTLQYKEATLSAGACGAYGVWTNTGNQPADTNAGSVNFTATDGKCYMFQYVLTDNNSHVTTVAPTDVTKVDTSAPAACSVSGVTEDTGAACQYTSGSTVYYNNDASCNSGDGQFTLTITAGADAESDVQKVNFPTTVSAGGDDSSSPYELQYTWSAASVFNAAETVTTYNNADLTSTCTISVLQDLTGPTGGTLTYTDGYATSTALTINYDTIADASSGIATYVLQFQEATLSGASCGAYGAWTNTGNQPASTAAGSVSFTATDAKCYAFQYVLTDNVGNVTTVSSASVTKVDTTAPGACSVSGVTEDTGAACQYTSGSTIYYNNNASCNSGDGQFTLTITPGADAESAVQKVNFPTTVSAGGDDSSSPYSLQYTWSAASTFDTAETVTTYNNAELTSTCTINVLQDLTGPTGGALTYTDGYATSTAMTINYSAITDATSGVASYVLQYQEATLSGASCGAYGAWTNTGNQPASTAAGSVSFTATDAKCYAFQYVLTDNVGNVTTVSSPYVTFIDTTAPGACSVSGVTETSGAACQYTSGSTIYYNNNASCNSGDGQFTLAITPGADAESDVQKVNFPTTVSAGGDDSAAPYELLYTWSAGSTFNTSETVTTYNFAELTSTCTINVLQDLTGPTGGSLTYTDGYATNTAMTINYDAVADATSGVATYVLQYQEATLSAGTCGAYGAWTNTGNQPASTAAGSVSFTATNAKCYAFQYVLTDNVGNVTTVSSASVTKVDTTAPGACSISGITPNTGTTCQYVSGSTVYYNSNAACNSGDGTFTVAVTAGADAESDVQKVNFPATVSAGGDDSAAPYELLYTYSNASVYSSASTVTTYNNAGLTNTCSFDVTQDLTGPTGGALTYTDGYATGTNLTINYGAVSDAGAGITSYVLQYKEATLSAGACGAYGAWTNTGNQPASTAAGSVSFTATDAKCYQFQYVLTDNVGNGTTVSSASVTKVDTTAPGACGISGITPNTGTTCQYVSGSTVYYNNNAACNSGDGTFTVAVTAGTDAESDVQKVNFPATVSAGGDDSASPYELLYTYSAASSFNSSATVTTYNNASLTNTCSFDVTQDITGPTGGALTYTDGYATSTSLTINYGAAADATSGVATYVLQYQEATLSNDTCGAYGAWTNTGNQPASTAAGNVSFTATDGKCYMFQYVLTDNVGNVSTVSSASVTKVDTTVPASCTVSGITPNTGTTCQYVSGTTVYYNNNASCNSGDGTFTVAATSSDAESGTQKINFPATVSVGGDDSTSPYELLYTYSAASSYDSSSTVTGYNNAGLTNTCTFNVTRDTASPTGGALTYTDGFATSTTLTINYGAVSDAISGLATYVLQYQEATLSAGACGAYGAWTNTGNQPASAAAGSVNFTATTGKCYQFQYVLTDNVGNVTNVTSASVTKVDTTAPGACTISGITPNTGTTCQYVSGSTVYYNNNAACNSGDGTFTVTATGSDAESDLLKLNFPATVSAGGDDTSSPYELQYTYSAASSYNSASTVTIYNNASLTNTCSFDVARDITGPTGGALTYTDGYATSTTLTINYGAVSDATAGVSSYVLQYQEATLSTGACGAYGGWTNTGNQPASAAAGSVSFTATAAKCYQFQYVLTDNVGNVTTVSSASVTKVDTTAPAACNLSGITPNTGTTCQYVSGSTVYYNNNAACNSGDGTFTVAVTAGADAESDVQKVNFPATVSTGGDDSASPYELLYTYSTASSYSSTSTVTTYNNADLTNTCSFDVTRDITGPTGGALTYTNGYSATTSVTINYGAVSDAGAGVSSYVLQYQEATLSAGACGAYGAWTNTGNQPASTAAGSVSFTATNAKCYQFQYVLTDNVGNISTVSSASVTKVDAVAPTVTINSPAASAWEKADFTVDVTNADTGGSDVSVCEYRIVSNSVETLAWTTYTCTTDPTATVGAAAYCLDQASNVCDIQFRATDAAGNVSTTVTRLFSIDYTAPTTTFVSPAASAWEKADFTVDVTNADTGSSGLSTCEYRILSNSIETLGWTTYTCTTDPTATVGAAAYCLDQGSNMCQVEFRATDVAGNLETAVSRQFSADWTAPTVTINSPAASTWEKADFTVDVTNADTGGSGTNVCEYRILSNSVETLGWTTYTCATDPTATVGAAAYCLDQGSNLCQVEFRLTDVAGNVGTTQSRQFSPDWTAPTVTINSPAASTWEKADFTVDVTNADTGGSDVSVCQYRILSNSVEQLAWTTYTCATDPTATVGAAAYCRDQNADMCEVQFKVTDASGNASTTQSRLFSIDWTGATAGTITPANSDSGTIVDGTFDLSATFNDGTGAGVSSCEYCITTDGTCDTEWAAATWGTSCTKNSITCTNGTTLTLNMRSTDGAGNIGTGAAITRTCDATPPTITARETADLDKDGYLDAIHITFDDSVLDSSVTAANFDVQGVTGEAFSSTTNGDTADDSDIYITFTPGGVWNTSSLPTVTYTQGTLTDAVGNLMASTGAIASTDKAPPVVLSAALGNGNGVMTVTFSENVTSTAVSRSDIFPVATGNKFGTTAPTTAQATNASSMTFTLNSANTDAVKFLSTDVFNFTGNETKIKDSANNDLTTVVGSPTVTLTADSTTPDILSAQLTSKTRVLVNFTEPPDMSSVSIADILVQNNGSPVAASLLTKVDYDTIQLDFASSLNDTYPVTAEMQPANTIEDLAGNALTNANDTQRTAADQATPSISLRETADLDKDGVLDTMHITFDEPILDSSVTASDFDVQGVTGEAFSSTTNGDTADDSDIYITFTPGGVWNTSSLPTVKYTSGTLTDLSGNLLATEGSAVASTDKAGPAITAVSTKDSNNDGTIDMMKVTLSENVTDAAFDNSKWAISDTSAIAAALQNPTGDVSNDNIIYLGITASTTNDTDLTTQVYDTTVTNGTLADAAGNLISDCSSVRIAETDGAPPVIIGTSISDSEPNGYLDSAVFTFSETLTGSGEIGDWTLTDFDGTTNLLSGLTNTNVVVNSNTVTINLANNSGTTGSPAYTYTQAGSDNIRDAASNFTLNKTSTSISDTAAPVLMSISSNKEISGGNLKDGTILTIAFSEDVSITPANVAAADFSVTNGSWHGGSSVTYADGAGYTITATLSGDTNTSDWRGSATFNRSAGVLSNLNSIEDTAGNDAVRNQSTSPTITGIADTTPPSITAISTLDDDHDGKLDAVKVTLSENMDDSTYTSTGWTLTNGLVLSGSLLSPVSESDTANDNVLYLGLTESSYNTGAIPDVTTDGTVTLTDLGGGNIVTTTTSGAITETDGARPVITAISTMDENLDGTIDMMKVTLSENITDANFDKTKWTVSDTSAIAASLQNPSGDVANDNVIYLGITANTLYDTDILVQVYDTTVTNGTLKDSANNYLADCNSACITESDGAAPVIYAANSDDANFNGFIDTVTLTFTENITGSGEIADWTLTDANGSTDLLTGLTDADITVLGNTATIAVSDNIGTTGAPTFSYSQNGSDNLQDSAGNIAIPIGPSVCADITKPIVRNITILDMNEDGTMDTAKVTFSENVVDSSYTNTGWAISDTSAVSNTLSNPAGDVADDNVIYIEFTATTTGDTDLIGQTYDTTATASTLKDPANNTIANCTSGAITETDGAGPAVKAIATTDANADGSIDMMKVTLTEAVTDADFSSTNWTVGDTTAIASSLQNPTGDTSDDAVIYIGVTPTTTNDTDLIGQTYDTTVTNGSLKDSSGNFIVNCNSAFVTETDGAGPAVIGAEAYAGGTSINITFSENVYNAVGAPASPAGDLSTGSLLYTDYAPASRTVSAFAAIAGSNTGVMTMSNPFLIRDDVGHDSVSPAAIAIYDNVGNAASTANSVILRDYTLPAISKVYEYDTDGDGNIDEVAVEFSEYMNDASITPAAAAQFVFESVAAVNVDNITNPAGGLAPSNATDPKVADDNFITLFLDDATLTGTELKQASFTTAVDKFEDGGANDLPTQAAITEVDKAAPAMISSVTIDSDYNGKIEAIDVTYSENITDPGVITTRWTATDIPSAGTLSSVFRSASNKIRLAITEGAGTADTAVGNLKFTYTNVASSIKDIYNNIAPSIPSTAPSDGANPIIIAAVTGEADGTENGFVDKVTLTYSEAVTFATGTDVIDIGDLTSNTLTGETYVSGSGSNTLVFSVTNSETASTYGDTGELPAAITYDHGAGTGNIEIVDLTGLHALDQSFGGTTDGAQPRIMAAKTYENSSSVDGYIDTIRLTYSEPVSIDAGAHTEFDVSDDLLNTLTSESCSASGCGSGTRIIDIGVTNSHNADAKDTHLIPASIVYSATGTVKDIAAAQNPAPIQTFTTITDGAAPWLDTLTLKDTSTASEAYSNSLTVDTTISGAAGLPLKMMIAQDSAFTQNSTGWVDFATSSTYTFTAGDGTRAAYIKLKDTDGNESVTASDTTVIDTTMPVLTISKPSAGIIVPAKVGYFYLIQWSASDTNMDPNPISIYLDTDDSQSFPITIATGVVNTGSYVWDTPELDTSTARIKVAALDLAGNITETISDVFTMDSTFPYVTVQQPVANVEWKGGSVKTIAWTVSAEHIDNAGPISIYYSTDDWFSSAPIALGLARGTQTAAKTYSGTYDWTVDSITSPVKIRVVATDDSNKSSYNATELPIIIDSTPPATGTIVITDNDDWTNDSTPVITISTTDNGSEQMLSTDKMKLACTEAGLSAASYISYSTTVTDFNLSTGAGCTAGDGAKQVWIEFMDIAGNVQTTHAHDSTNLETDANDSVANLRACKDSSCAELIETPPAYSTVGDPYFDWDEPTTGPAPYEGYNVIILPRTAATPTDCTVNATNTYRLYTPTELAEAVAGTNGEATFWIRAIDKAGNCGPAVNHDINIDSAAPASPTVIVESYEYLDSSVTPNIYWVRAGNSFNISVRYYEPISIDRSFVSFNRNELDHTTLYHDWNSTTGTYVEDTVGAVFISPVNGVETEGTGNGAAFPSPSSTGYFKYTWTMSPLTTNASYYVQARGIDMLSNDSDWSSNMLYLNIDATRPTFTLKYGISDTATATISTNAQNVFTNDTTITFNGTLADSQSGPYRIDLESTSGNNSGTDLPSSWTIAVPNAPAEWSYTTPAVTGHNTIRFRGLDHVFNVTSSDEGDIADVNLYVDNVPPLSPSGLSATAPTSTRINLWWANLQDQGAGTGATNGVDESYSTTQNWYRAGDVGVKVYRTLTSGTAATATLLNWTSAVGVNDTGLQPNATYRYDIITRDNSTETRGTWHNQAATSSITISTLANPVVFSSITPSYDPMPSQGGTGLGHILTAVVNPGTNTGTPTYIIKMKSPSQQTVTTTSASYDFTHLVANTSYCFTVAVQNPDGIQTAESAITCGSTYNFDDVTPPDFAGITSISDPEIGSTLDLSWNEALDESIPISYRIYVATTPGGQNFSGSAFVTQDTTYRVTTLNDGTALVDGTTYYFVVRAQDGSVAKNTEENTVELSGVPTKDIIPPPLDLDPTGSSIAINNVITNSNKISVSGVTESGATIEITVSQSGASLSPAVDTSGAFATDTPLVAGQNDILVTAVDHVGNFSTQSAIVYYDATLPTVSITSPESGASVSGAGLTITGTAVDNLSLATYKVEYGPGTSPTTWKTITSGSSPVTAGTLATWDTTGHAGDYTFRLTATDSAGNSSSTTVSVSVSNTSSVNGTIPAGKWTMIAVSGMPLSSNPASFLGSGSYALRKWDPTKTTNDPVLYKYLTEFSIAEGQGFWVMPFGTDISYTLTTEVTDTTTKKSIHLNNNWNQIGVPFGRAMLWGDVQVRNTSTGETKTMSAAASAGWIVGGVAYGWESNSYVQKTATDRLAASAGFFVKCGDATIVPSGCDLLFDPNSEQTGGLARIVGGPRYDFKLQVSASNGDTSDSDNFIGITSAAKNGNDALDTPEPPTIEGYVSLYFNKDDWGRMAGRYSNDVRPSFDGSQSWEFSVDSDSSGKQISVTFPNAAQLPQDYIVNAEDLSTGASFDINSGTSYIADGTTHAFRVTVRAPERAEETVSYTLNPGWNLVTIPADPAVTDAVDNLSDNMTVKNVYQYYEKKLISAENDERVDIQTGIAYWIYVDEATLIDVKGKTTPISRQLTVPLAQGWNLIGNPYTSALTWGDNIKIEYGGNTYTISEAASQGIINKKLMKFDSSAGYVEETDSIMVPWRGYILKANMSCNLIYSNE